MKYKADYNGTRKVDGASPLLMSSFNGQELIVKWLLSLPNIDVFHKSSTNLNAFSGATFELHINIASHLYTYAMNECLYDNNDPRIVEFVNQPNINGDTPLMAIFDKPYGDKDPETMIKFLVEKCKVRLDVKSNDGQTVFDKASRNSSHDMLMYLSEQSSLREKKTCA